MEILAPAGGIDTIEPAVRAGADAVYLGASAFSARASAKNFDKEELKSTVEYCRQRGVRVYLACNTLVRDDELKKALGLIEYACELPVDAVIIQDIGLAELVKKAAPGLRLHASTQMSVHTLGGVELLAEQGFKRVVLSRELSRDEIAEIAAKSPIELEVFVHGALCMCVSGQCWFSAMLGGRSGNRGACAQPCRLPFSVKGGTGHDLSLKDQSLIACLRELEEMGIASAKIEGRMKRPEYTAAAVAACRQSLDTGTADPELLKKLEAVFSRSGFTQGYYTGSRGREMFGIRSKENVMSATGRVMNSLHELYKNERQSVPIDASLTVRADEPAVLEVSDGSGHSVSVKGGVPEPAVKVELTKERCAGSITKTGGTPFFARGFEAEIGKGLSLPMNELNSMRRQALSELLEKRAVTDPVGFAMPDLPGVGTRRKTPPKYCRARFTDGNISDAFLDCELVYVPMTLKDSEFESLMDRGFAVAVEIPRGMFGLESRIFRRLGEIKALGINEVLAGNPGAVQIAKSIDMDIHGGFGLNLINTAALDWAEKTGIMDAEVSIELTAEQISRLGGRIPIGIVSSGRLPLMLTRNCPADNSPQREMLLRDRKGMEFPLQSCGACTEVLNSVPLDLADRRRELIGADFEVLRFSVEDAVEREEIFRLFNSGECRKGQHTRGLYYRGVE